MPITQHSSAFMRSPFFHPVRNAYLRVFRHDYWKRRVYNLRKFYSQFVPNDSLVFDLGANIGEYSRCFLSLGARVVALEPIPKLAQNLMLIPNKKLLALPFAAGDKMGLHSLRLSDTTEVSSLSDEWLSIAKDSPRFQTAAWTDTIEVQVVTVDYLIEKYGMPHFIKIDVEGFEPQVLDGMTTMPKALSFEFQSEWMEPTIECLRKPCFPKHARFNYIVLEPDGEPVLPHWVTAEEMIHLAETKLKSYGTFGDILARR